MIIPVDTSIPAQNPQLSTFKFGDQQIRVIDNTIFASKPKFEDLSWRLSHR